MGADEANSEADEANTGADEANSGADEAVAVDVVEPVFETGLTAPPFVVKRRLA